MQNKLLNKICCPYDKNELELRVFETHKKKYGDTEIEEVLNGVLISKSDWLYPIINGVPRMQFNSFLDHEILLKKYYPAYNSNKRSIINKYGKILSDSVKKTKKTGKSFGQEWKIFKYDSDTTWGFSKDTRKKRFLKELLTDENSLKGKSLIDIGCGNGVLTSGIAEFGMETFGIDVSPSVERAYLNNQNVNSHFLQADLQNPPFKNQSFDIVYSTGVLHHTNNTELSFSCICPLLKHSGRLYIWLYKPEKDLRHNFLINLRKFTNKLPIAMQYVFYLTFLVPQGLIKEKLRGKKISWREQLINYFDVLSPEFRFEHTPEEVRLWFTKRNFGNINVSITEYLGFGIFGDLN
ncbi:MAG: methyltransferase domain-containing protein [Ignavibacteria bacterium]|jgi:2-polyprenyl-3-methyl-5-hydroxy-6-metoxy-1,4-benzoquinol methylase